MNSDNDTQPAEAPAHEAPAQPAPKQLIVVNTAGSGVTSAESLVMINAIATLLGEVCKHWNRSANLRLVVWDQMVASDESAADDAMRYFLVDDHQNISAAFKEHSETNGASHVVKMNGIVLTKPIFAAAGVVIDPDGKHPSVAAALFKAIAESLINPTGNLWWQDPACGELVAAKICDPVEGIPVVVTLTMTPPAPRDAKTEVVSEDGDAMPPLESIEPEKINVALCDFVLPAWSDAASSSSRFDFMSVLKSPFDVATGGSLCKHEPIVAAPRLTFDRRAPVWRRKSREVQMILDAINMRST